MAGLENDKTARHLFAVAGQLHEAAVIPVARLGLLAGVRGAIDQKVDAGRAGTGQCMPGGAAGGGPDPAAPAGAGVRQRGCRVGTTTRLSVALCA